MTEKHGPGHETREDLRANCVVCCRSIDVISLLLILLILTVKRPPSKKRKYRPTKITKKCPIHRRCFVVRKSDAVLISFLR
jgi:hypothetical protein